MSIRNFFLAAGALTLAAAPVAASAANPAASLSVAKSVRAASASDKRSQMAGGIDYVIIAMVIIGGLAIYAIVEDQSDDPTSP